MRKFEKDVLNARSRGTSTAPWKQSRLQWKETELRHLDQTSQNPLTKSHPLPQGL